MNIFEIILIIASILVFLFLIILLGNWLRTKKIKRLVDERDHVDLTTFEGRNRARSLNNRIDRMYGYK